MTSTAETVKRSEGEQSLSAPAISLPKGGGAIRGIGGEVRRLTRSLALASMSVPIATSPGILALARNFRSPMNDSGAG